MQFINKCSLFIIALLMVACGGNNRDWDVAIDSVEYEPTYYRLDQKLGGAQENELPALNKKWQEDLGQFYSYYLGKILQSGSPKDSAITDKLYQFIQDSAIAASFQQINQKFESIDNLKKSYENGMKRLKKHFQKMDLPDTVILYHSVFTNGVMATKSQLAVGVEMYLGSDNAIVQLLPKQNYPDYFKAKMEAKYLPFDMIRSWVENHLYKGEEKSRLADIMVEKGKVIYLLSAFYPEADPWLKMRYSDDEWAWCLENEYSIWRHIVDQEYIFSDQPDIHRNFFSNGPFTPGLAKNSPSRAGEFMGYRIVRQYMNKHRDVGLEELLQINNTQKILNAYEIEQ